MQQSRELTERRTTRQLVLWLLPFFLVAALPFLFRYVGPYYQAEMADPDYTYLESSLALRTGGSPYFWDHPGATVQALGAPLIYLQTAGLGRDAAVSEVFSRPEDFIHQLVTAQILLIALLSALTGWLLYRACGSPPTALLLQVIPFLSSTTWITLPRYRPDSLLMALSALLCALFSPVILNSGPVSRRRAAAGGVVGGLVLATKVTGLPVLLVPAWLLRKRLPDLALFLLLCAAAFAATVGLVNYRAIGEFAAYFSSWIFRIAVHKGPYGMDGAGAPSAASYVWNLGRLIAASPVAFAILAVSTALAAVPRLRTATQLVLCPHTALLGGVAALQYFLAAKNPAGHYVMPIFPVIAYLAAPLAQRAFLRNAALGLAAVGLIYQPLELAFGPETRARLALLAMKEELVAQNHCLEIPFYVASTQSFALWIGNYFSRDQFMAEFERRYPGFLLYSPIDKSFLNAARASAPPPEPSVPLCLRGSLGAVSQPAVPGRATRLIIPTPLDAFFVVAPKN